jgi:hypothetical protein
VSSILERGFARRPARDFARRGHFRGSGGRRDARAITSPRLEALDPFTRRAPRRTPRRIQRGEPHRVRRPWRVAPFEPHHLGARPRWPRRHRLDVLDVGASERERRFLADKLQPVGAQ